MKCDDLQALDLLCSPSSVSLCLRRRVGFFLRGGPSQPQWKDEMKGTIEDVESAVWWPSLEGGASEPHKRRLNGEIHLPKSLKPTSAMAHFSIVVCDILRDCFKFAGPLLISGLVFHRDATVQSDWLYSERYRRSSGAPRRDCYFVSKGSSSYRLRPSELWY